MIKVFYYYYYLFYTRIIPDDEPHSTVIWTLSLSVALIIDCIISLFVAVFFGVFLRKWFFVLIFILVLVGFYLIFDRNRKGAEIVEMRPNFFNKKGISIVLTLLFFLVSIAPVFLLIPIVKQILS